MLNNETNQEDTVVDSKYITPTFELLLNSITDDKKDDMVRISALLGLYQIIGMRLEQEGYVSNKNITPSFRAAAQNGSSQAFRYLKANMSELTQVMKGTLSEEQYLDIRKQGLIKTDVSLSSLTKEIFAANLDMAMPNVPTKEIVKISEFSKKQGFENFASILEQGLALPAYS